MTDAGRVDVEWLSNAIELDCMNTERLYREAVEKGMGMKVNEAYLYMFTTGETIDMMK